ncbi:hypothetical protein EMMF5_003769 [Cystobasidiomycetes sp. EMM_F5]
MDHNAPYTAHRDANLGTSYDHSTRPDSSMGAVPNDPATSLASPTFSPPVGSYDYNQLLEAFTHSNVSNDGLASPQTYLMMPPNILSTGISPSQYQNNYMQFGPSFSDSTASSHDQAHVQYPLQSSPHTQQSLDLAHHGLRIHPAHFDPVPPNLPISTVERLENVAASYPSSNSMQSHAMAFSQQGPLGSNALRGSVPTREVKGRRSKPSSRRSTLDGSAPQMSALSLNSPVGSMSTESSTSSLQNSPITPLSAYGYVVQGQAPHTATRMLPTFSGQFQYAQQQPLNVHRMSIDSAKLEYDHQAYHHHQAPLAASLPASFAHDPALVYSSMNMAHPRQQQHTIPFPTQGDNTASKMISMPVQMTQSSASSVPLQQSTRSRMSSAGLMDRIVSSREISLPPAATSPETIEGIMHTTDLTARSMPPSTSSSDASTSSRTSRSSSSKSATPPTTPARTGGSRITRSSASKQTPTQTQTTPTAQFSQTESLAGPHRTPSKRNLSAMASTDFNRPSGFSPAVPVDARSTKTPQRPGIRRTASHTPQSSRPGSAGNIRLQAMSNAVSASPYDQQFPSRLSSADYGQPVMQAFETHLVEEVHNNDSSSILRTQSTPGLLQDRPSSSLQNALGATSMLPVTRSRRAGTLSLQMSPLSAPSTSSSPQEHVSAPPSPMASFADALNALNVLSNFLAFQSTRTNTVQPNEPALGTPDQHQAISDLRYRVQMRMSGSAPPLSAARNIT